MKMMDAYVVYISSSREQYVLLQSPHSRSILNFQVPAFVLVFFSINGLNLLHF